MKAASTSEPFSGITLPCSRMSKKSIVAAKDPAEITAPTLKLSASSGFRFGLPKLSTSRTVANCGTNCSEVSGFGCSCNSTGPRNVLLAEPRSASDLPVTVTPVGPSSQPSPIASMQSPGYRLIAGLAASTFDTPIAPLLMIGMTDSRHMTALSDDIYRFTPVQLGTSDTGRIHGIDERISIENLGRMLGFTSRCWWAAAHERCLRQEITARRGIPRRVPQSAPARASHAAWRSLPPGSRHDHRRERSGANRESGASARPHAPA